ncbi:MAG: CDP-diacylglycerol--glycerol-3-phosphate 3-phosphatidyltransferase [Pirellulales bacterium]
MTMVDATKTGVLNVPNSLTAVRLVLAVVMFITLALGYYATSTGLFIVAAGTDWVDGFWARRYGQVTTLGRIIDPLADKVVICGTFIFLVGVPVMSVVPWGLRPWMVVVVVGRELLVTALRGLVEQQGSDFSARMSGKLKMVLQCVAAVACLVYLAYGDPAAGPMTLPDAPGWLWATMVVSLWAAVALTVYSGAIYIVAAAQLMRRG